MFASLFAILGTGFSLGLLHAFDADHVMAVTTLSNDKPNFKRTLKFSLQWALGHGGVLLLCGILLFGLGIHLPEALVGLAETSVGILLIVIGILCIRKCYQQKLKLVTHEHNGVTHTHWVLDAQQHKQTNEHAPTFVGMLHGLAGSAPALALVPLLAQEQTQFMSAMLYLLVFSLGVLLSMVTFGAGLGSLQRRLLMFSGRIFQATRYTIASAAIALGAFWLTA